MLSLMDLQKIEKRFDKVDEKLELVYDNLRGNEEKHIPGIIPQVRKHGERLDAHHKRISDLEDNVAGIEMQKRKNAAATNLKIAGSGAGGVTIGIVLSKAAWAKWLLALGKMWPF